MCLLALSGLEIEMEMGEAASMEDQIWFTVLLERRIQSGVLPPDRFYLAR